MSGVKDTIVNLRQSEYNRMMQACQRVGNLDQEIRRAVQAKEQDVRREIQREVRERGEAFEKSLRAMDQTIADMHRSHSKALQEQARETETRYRSLDHRIDVQRSELLGLMQDQERRLDNTMAQQRREFDGKIRLIQDRLNARDSREQELAETWLRDTRSFLDFLGHQYHHEKFAPGALERLQGQLSLATQNARSQQYQAALATTQQVFLQGQELRGRLELHEMEWNLQLEEARRGAVAVIAACEAQTLSRLAFDVTNESGAQEQIEIAAEIDHWTHGDLTRLLSKARETEAGLQTGLLGNLSLEDLKEITQLAKTHFDELEMLAARAREAIIASQLRHNIAWRIEDALRGEGWEIKDSAYEEEDQRETLHVKLCHLNGAEIVTQIRPQETEPGKISNVVSMAFYDDSIADRRVIQSRLGKVAQSLAREGLDVGVPKEAPGFEGTVRGDEKRRDFEQVRRRRNKDKN